MKKWIILFILIGFLVSLSTALTKVKTFKGAFFDIKYPASFKAIPSLNSGYMPEKVDSARFISPDRLVEFYVLAPMWNADASEVALDPKKEKLISESNKSRVMDSTGSVERIKQVTIKAKDGSYTRSYIDRETDYNTRLIFGIKYTNKQAYDKYKNDYLLFKRSIKQYSD